MKTLLTLALLSTSAFAQDWSETFKLPEGMTYRVKAAGFDCGTFSNKYVGTPAVFQEQQVIFRQLAADKDLNKFLIEATFPGTLDSVCTYGAFLDRNRTDKTLDFTRSEIVTNGAEGACAIGQAFLDARLQKAAYEPSKRGIRYIAVNVMNNEANEVCESGTVRMVFDRRL